MGLRVSIEGGESIQLDEKVVESVEFLSEVPQDSNARTTHLAVTMQIKGKILTVLGGAEQSIKIGDWSRVAATDATCYRKLTVQDVSEGQTVRQFELPNAFVVDYTEEFDVTNGTGTFLLIARQKRDEIPNVQITGGF